MRLAAPFGSLRKIYGRSERLVVPVVDRSNAAQGFDGIPGPCADFHAQRRVEKLRRTIEEMPLKLDDNLIRATCWELIASGQRVTARVLRRALRERYGVTARTSVVLDIWCQEMLFQSARPAPKLPVEAKDAATEGDD